MSSTHEKFRALLPALALTGSLAACTQVAPERLQKPVGLQSRATLTPATQSHGSLEKLPPPKGRIAVAVYGFRDLTGQYKPAPDSSYSTAMTQGGTALLTKALLDSRWFIPLEREGLQNLLTERRIARSQGEGEAAGKEEAALPALHKAAIIIEGGIIAYESNVRTGGAGIRYFGIGASDQYRVDQITVSLRAVDVRTGQVMATLNTTKSVYSMKIAADVYRYVRFKRLLDAEAGLSRNEPAQLCLQDAVEAGVVHLVALGIQRNLWSLQSEADRASPLLQEAWVEQGLLPAKDDDVAAPKRRRFWSRLFTPA
ncbi:MAG: curli production assembly/transport component CsgG [Moraxellaceae bacterium]|jgi:curli production assembly/transport component CsgG|nr:curli production assembly/transport component CsgG [Moraxellaceae bacterium]